MRKALAAAALLLPAAAPAADTGRRAELQVFNNTQAPLRVESVEAHAVWLPDLEPEVGQTVTTFRPATWGIAPRRLGTAASAVVTLRGHEKGRARLELSLPAVGNAQARVSASAGLGAEPPVLVSREGSRWIYRVSVFSPELQEARRAELHRAPTWRDELTEEQVKFVEEALNRGKAKAKVCFTVFDSPHADAVRLDVRVDGSKGKVTKSSVHAPYRRTPIADCLEKAFVGELVLPFEGRRQVPVSFERPARPAQ